MKQLYTRLALIVLLLVSFSIPKETFGAVDEEEIKEKLPLMMGQNNVGKDYWFSIPPCYEDESAGHDNFVKILITSPVKTKVTVEGSKGFYVTKQTIPNGVIEIKVNPAVAQAILHSGRSDRVREAQVYKGAGVHVTAEDPIVVYVMVRYYYTSDGFLAIPTSAFGTEYINMVYKEPDLGTQGWMSPFTAITAAYDQTKVNFTMGGGDQFDDGVPLYGGRVLKAGESTSEYMDKGDVWLLSINGKRQDLSGSKITGNKPFCIVSGVHCANFPLRVYACDYTVEMELPTYTWGKQYYVTPIMNRTFNGIIRIFASEDNTEVFRNESYVGTIMKGGGAPMNEGYLEMRVWPKLDDFGQVNPPKIATFTANKPISIMYYNTGTTEDNPRVITDPFMMVFSPIEQFQTEVFFSSPNATSGADPFTENYVIIVFEVHDGFMPPDLKFAEMYQSGAEPEWKPISQVFGGGYQEFTVPYKGKTYGTTRLVLGTEGVYGIKSDSTKFAAYSYGFSNFDSYGFPTSAALNDLTKPDTNAPIPTYVQTCDGDILIDMGIVTDMPDDDETRSNMADLYLISNLNDNYLFDWRSKTGEFIPGQQRTLSWWLTVKDKKQRARAEIYFTDRAGNDTTIVVEYNPPEYEVVDDNKFGIVNETNGPVTMQETIRNLHPTEPLLITRVELQKGDQGFKIDSYEPNTWAPGMEIAPLSEVKVNISFDPLVAKALDQPVYIDSLGVGYAGANGEECAFYYETEQEAFIGAPVIEVTDADFGKVNIINPNAEVKQIFIKNNSAKQPLNVFGIFKDVVLPEFTHDFADKFPNVSEANPLTIAPGEAETFNVFFKPTAEQIYTDNIVFKSDAATIDSVALLSGQGISSAVTVNGYEWNEYLIDRPAYPEAPHAVDAASPHQGFYLENLGTEVGVIVRVVDVEVVSETPNAREYFRVDNQNIHDYLMNLEGRNLQAGDNIDKEVLFNPTQIGDHEIVFAFSFNGIDVAPIEITYSGTGLVPNLTTSDVQYGEMLVDDEAGALSGQFMTITNNNLDFPYELTVEGLTLTDAANVSADYTDFQGRTYKYDGTLLPATIPVGGSLQIPVDFVARLEGDNPVLAEVISNANTTVPEYDPASDWNGIGKSVGLNVIPVDKFPCLNDGPFTYPVRVENTTDDDVNIDNLSLNPTDLDGDGIDDVSILSQVTNLVVAGGGFIDVSVSYDPSTPFNKEYVELVIGHNYGNNITISGDETALYLGSKSLFGNTTSNVTGATADRSQTPPRYLVSIGDEFDYEITFEGNANGADITEFTVNLNYNSYFVQPKFGINELDNIDLGAGNAQIRANTFTIFDNLINPQKGSKSISFVVESSDDQPILTNAGLIATLPFLAVLPADNELFDPTEVVAGNENFGVFDMSHTLTGIVGCYENTADLIEVGIREICEGTLRLLYIGDLEGQAAGVTPNPINNSGGTIEYSVPFDQQGEIAIYNATMQKVATIYNGMLKQGRQSIDIPVSDLANGSYYFKITMGQKQELGRLIIQK